jgi:threonine dehydratase
VLDDGVLVDDEQILRAMRLIHRHVGLVIEPSGAVGVAAVLAHPDRFRGQRVGTILCGGNVTDEQRRDWLAPR